MGIVNVMITTVTGKNQITIPAKIASTHKIKAGTRLEWEPTDEPGVLKVRVLPDRATLAVDMLGAGRKHVPAHVPAKAAPVEELTIDRQTEDEARHTWD
jgi:AbrB family looped-hinge helix DNA binding protein